RRVRGRRRADAAGRVLADPAGRAALRPLRSRHPRRTLAGAGHPTGREPGREMTANAALAEWRGAGRAFVHRGHGIFFWEGGTRPGADEALLLIHGVPPASWDWHKVWGELCGKFPRVIAADMIGFGFSAKP